MSNQPDATYLGLGSLPPILLGNLDEDQRAIFLEAFELYMRGQEPSFIYAPALDTTRSRANAAAPGATTADIESYLRRPLKAMELALLPNKVLFGPNVGEAVSLPITKPQLEQIPLDVAAVNLAIFFPKIAKMLGADILQLFESRGNQGISQQDLEALKKSSASAKKIELVQQAVVDSLLSTNKKLEKMKVPSSLGIGEVFEGDPRYAEAPVAGSVGLDFLPHSSLVSDFGETRSYLNSLKAVIKKNANSPKKADADFKAKLHSLTTQKDVLENLLRNPYTPEDRDIISIGEPRKKAPKMTCCPNASIGCSAGCLADAGERYKTVKDVLGGSLKKDEYDLALGRAALGARHTAFIANPYFFIRVLVEACIQRAVSYHGEVLKESLYASVRGEPFLEMSEYLQKVPCSVRLNVYSDYIWEVICPDLFKMFSGRSGFGYRGSRLPKIQFYDYTKIPGRWTKSQRKKALELGSIESDPLPNYSLPNNYHLTFSFNGLQASEKTSRFCLSLGQNATYVFCSLKGTINTLADIKKYFPNSPFNRKGLSLFLESVRKAICLAHGVSPEDPYTKTLKEEQILPTSYQGYRVVSGDYYDLRYLDKAFSKRDEGLIVGLNWKAPRNVYVNVGDRMSGFTINPLVAALLYDYLKDGSAEDKSMAKKLSAVASFGIVRLFAGTVRVGVLEAGSATQELEGTIPVSFFVAPKGRPSLESTKRFMEGISEAGEALADSVTAQTFLDSIAALPATESGHALITVDSASSTDTITDALLTQFNLEIDIN